MFSKPVVCNAIRAVKLYHQKNIVGFCRRNKIDEEGGRYISSVMSIKYNKKTNVYSVSAGIAYYGCTIGPQQTGKQNCNDDGFVKNYTETHLKAARTYNLKKTSERVKAWLKLAESYQVEA